MFTPKEGKLYHQCEDGFLTVRGVIQFDGELLHNPEILIERMVDGDLSAYEECLSIYGSILGACNNL